MAAATCFHCGKLLDLPEGMVGRGETCPHCSSDVKVCKNCLHYDLKAYNECREPSAERVVDKEKRNFCDYFSLSGGGSKDDYSSKKEDALKDLDSLFKK